MSDEFTTFRDPLLSLYQSAVAEVAQRIDEKGVGRASARSAGRLQRSAASVLPAIAAAIAQREFDQTAGAMSRSAPRPVARELTRAGMAHVCAELALRYFKALAANDQNALSQIQNEYTAGTCDVEWLTTLDEYRRYFDTDGRRKPVPYIRAAAVGASALSIKASARIAILGDWGTGAPPAIEVLRCIAQDQPDVLVHLGDIYYSGTPRECVEHFTNPIDKTLRQGSTPLVYTLSGNHDMYCGGVGFYDLISQLNPPPSTQPASFFCLRSEDAKWQLLAMDTGLHDDDPLNVADVLTWLEEDEISWHCDRIREFPGRSILLSHHQLFSAFSAIGPTRGDGKRSAVNPLLRQAFERLNASQAVAAWFWGHEHTLSIYKPFAGLERGRCVGHSAVPVSVVDQIYRPLSDLDETPAAIEATRLAAQGGVYAHGYALLQFEGSSCRAQYFQVADGGRQLIYEESFA